MNFLEALKIVSKNPKNVGFRPVSWKTKHPGCCWAIRQNKYIVAVYNGSLRKRNQSSATMFEKKEYNEKFEVVDEKTLNEEYKDLWSGYYAYCDRVG